MDMINSDGLHLNVTAEGADEALDKAVNLLTAKLMEATELIGELASMKATVKVDRAEPSTELPNDLNGKEEAPDKREPTVGIGHIGGVYCGIKAIGLVEKINLINEAINLYREADRFLEQASQISVEILMEDGFQQNVSELNPPFDAEAIQGTV